MADKTSKEIQILDLNSWKKGQVSYFSKSRMQNDALKAAYNVIFDYNGIVRPRGSFNETDIPDLPEGLVPLGQDFAFKRPDNTEGLLNVFRDGTGAHLYVLKADNSGWTKFSNITYDKTKPMSFTQSDNKVIIGDGVTKFSYYDIENDTTVQLVKVDDPLVAPTITGTGFSGTPAFDYYYRIALNGISGSTKMSPAGTKVASSTIRDTWAGARSVTTNISSLTLDSDAKGWFVCMASVSAGTGAPTEEEYFPVSEELPMSQKTYIDTGEMKLLTKVPVENTTEGIIAGYFTNISGRLWAIGNDNRVYWGGDEGHEIHFGTSNGAGSYPIDIGGIETPMAITLGRDNAGTTCINLLTRTMAGLGAIWDVYATTNSITANGQSFSQGTYQFKKREGDDGTDAPFSVIRANNNAYYLSMDGFKSTGVKPNISGIQSTDIVSSAIRDRVLNLAHSDLSKTYAAYYDEALYWTVAYGSQKNNEIWMYDMLHGGIWSIWKIEADCVFRWASTNNESPSLYIRQGNKLLRYYKNSRSHADASGVFESYIESGYIPFGESNLEWVHILKNIWQFDQAIGVIDLTVDIHAKNGEVIKSVTLPFTQVDDSVVGSSGWDAVEVTDTMHSKGAWDFRSWDETFAKLDELGDTSDKKVSQKIRKNAAFLSFKIRGNTRDTYYELSHLSILFTYIGVGIEFLSQKGVIKI